jgi:hypothetical protein
MKSAWLVSNPPHHRVQRRKHYLLLVLANDGLEALVKYVRTGYRR